MPHRRGKVVYGKMASPPPSSMEKQFEKNMQKYLATLKRRPSLAHRLATKRNTMRAAATKAGKRRSQPTRTLSRFDARQQERAQGVRQLELEKLDRQRRIGRQSPRGPRKRRS